MLNINDSKVENGPSSGISVSWNSRLWGRNVTVQNNEGNGIEANQNSLLNLSGATISNNGQLGISAHDNVNIELEPNYDDVTTHYRLEGNEEGGISLMESKLRVWGRDAMNQDMLSISGGNYSINLVGSTATFNHSSPTLGNLRLSDGSRMEFHDTNTSRPYRK